MSQRTKVAYDKIPDKNSVLVYLAIQKYLAKCRWRQFPETNLNGIFLYRKQEAQEHMNHVL